MNIEKIKLRNYFIKEYLMYFGKFFLKGKTFSTYLKCLHNYWQFQVLNEKPTGNVLHILLHGNSYKIIKKFQDKGIKVIGEVVNVHPTYQEILLEKEYSVHGFEYKYGEKNFKNKIIAELEICDFLLVPSSFIKDSLITNNISANKIKVIPYAVNNAINKKEGKLILQTSLIKILCVSQITFRKGIFYLLEAMKLFREKGYNCELTLIGKIDPDYYGVIKELMNSNYVKHIQHVNNDQIFKIMSEHDLFILPSIEDGCSVVVLEALSVNLPVITTKNNGASELIINGDNGFVIEAFSVSSILQILQNCINHNFSFTKKVSNWQGYSEELIDFYSSVI